MNKFSAFVVRNRRAIIIVFLAVTLFFAIWIPRLQVNSDLVSYLPKDDPAVSLFHSLGERFGQNDLVLAALQADDVFSTKTLKDLARLTEMFQAVDGVTGVMSLTNMMDIRPASDGGIEIGTLVDPYNLPSTPSEARDLRAYVLGKERYRNSIVSGDGRTALIICRTRSDADSASLVQQLRAAAAAAGIPEGTLHFGGNPLLVSELGAIIFHDFRILIPIVIALIVITLFLTFRTIRGVLIPLASVSMSTIWLVGFMGLAGVSLTLISDIIPALLMALGTAPCIHLLSKFDEDVRRYGARAEDTHRALGEVGIRIILAALTIILGFSSFIVGSYLTTIRDFGILASIGVAFSLLISVMFVPAVLATLKVAPRKAGGREGGGLMHRAMTKWAGIVVRHRTAILVVSGIVLLLGAVGVPLIRRESDFAYFLDPDNPVRRTESILQKEFGGSRTLQVDFTGDLGNPFVLKEMLRFEMFMAGEGLAQNPVSIADLILEMNDIIDGQRTIPDDPAKVANLMFMLEGQDIVRGLVTADAMEGQIQAMVGMLGTKELQRTTSLLDKHTTGMPKKLVVVDLESLPAQDRIPVARVRASRAAEDIVYLARKRAASVAPLPGPLAEDIAGLFDVSGRIADPARASASILSRLPAALQRDSFFAAELKGELMELAQRRAAVPESLFKTLSVSTQPAGQGAPERVEFGVSYTGMPLIGWHLDQSVLWSQAQSLLFALVFIFVLLTIKLRSWRGGAIGLVPIGLAIVLMFGLMGILGIPINVATVLVGCIALGIGIDYSIHFSVRFTTYYQGSTSAETAVTQTIQTTGLAIVINVLAVTMGFVALMFARLLPLRQFGLLTAIAMIGSGFGALSLLPALILIFPSAFSRRTRTETPAGARRQRRRINEGAVE